MIRSLGEKRGITSVIPHPIDSNLLRRKRPTTRPRRPKISLQAETAHAAAGYKQQMRFAPMPHGIMLGHRCVFHPILTRSLRQ